MKIKYTIKEDPDFGYKHITPLPSEDQLSYFYKEQYYQHLQELQKTGRGGRNPKLSGTDEVMRKREQEWMEKTYFTDILVELNKFVGSQGEKSILDVGCGTGEFLQFVQKAGWKTFGTEPSEEAKEKAESKGIKIYSSLEELNRKQEMRFDVITLINVLEHVIDPKKTINNLKNCLKQGGVLYVQVPNDFNKLQNLASKKIKEQKWWITAPAHISYFDFQSLEKLLKFYGFDILLKTTDFPMELFLLMGYNYIDNPALGKECHQKRVNFEYSINDELRRNFYNKLAELDLGRDCRVYAQKM